MEFEVRQIDLEACRQAGSPPQDVIDRSQGDCWYVPITPIFTTAEPIQWALYRAEPYVQIALMPYLMHVAPELALGYMVQVGVTAAVDLVGQLRQSSPKASLQKLLLSIGRPAETIFDELSGQSKLRYQLGLAMLVKQERQF